MPVYEYDCDKCQREVQFTLSISAHDKGQLKAPSVAAKPFGRW